MNLHHLSREIEIPVETLFEPLRFEPPAGETPFVYTGGTDDLVVILDERGRTLFSGHPPREVASGTDFTIRWDARGIFWVTGP